MFGDTVDAAQGHPQLLGKETEARDRCRLALNDFSKELRRVGGNPGGHFVRVEQQNGLKRPQPKDASARLVQRTN
eukprot:scaffold48_cov311-Pinguiococcus_pyrenoidosus.AAC.292